MHFLLGMKTDNDEDLYIMHDKCLIIGFAIWATDVYEDLFNS